ncbi:hypothetical protein EON82_00515 [bacterium]|nr:MAG: hypothetical protein EON82_00515 [bacterium]
MATLSGQIAVTPAERTAISDAILRLDPLQKHGQHEPEGDLRRLWRRVDSALASLDVQGPSEAYPLTASLETAAKRSAEFPGYLGATPSNQLSEARSAGAAVAKHPTIANLLPIIEVNNMNSPEEE